MTVPPQAGSQTNARTAVQTLAHWNALDPPTAAAAILPCCGSHAWAAAMAAVRPFADRDHLLTAAAELWRNLPPADQDEAFRSHPRIGESHAPAATAPSLVWSATEQSTAQSGTASDPALRESLANLNAAYEARFGRTFLICAAGRTAPQILAEGSRRLANDHATELTEAEAQQRQITTLRLTRWLEESSA